MFGFVANEAMADMMKPEQIAEKISIAPRKFLTALPSVSEKSEANFTIF
jgi:hypothetical protein